MKNSYSSGDIEIRHSRLFIRNLISFLIPVILPVLILGSFSIIITHQYIQNNIDINNENILKQIRFQLELVFGQMESIYSSIANNPEINQNVKRILGSKIIDVEDYTMVRYVSNSIKAQKKAHPYIHSIYLYYENNGNRFLTTNKGLIVDDYYDMKWLGEYNLNKNKKDNWLTYRKLNPGGSEQSPVNVISLYWVLKNNGNNDGVMVLNIYADYIRKLLKGIETLPQQIVLVKEKEGDILFSNRELSYLEELDVFHTLQMNNEKMIKSQLESNIYNWDYYSIVPEKVIYKIPLKIRTILVFLLVTLILLAFVVSYFLTKRNYIRIKNIIDIINHAELGKELPEINKDVGDEYSYITNKIIKTFIQNSYLKLQVSEKIYRQKTLEMLALQAQINPHFLYNTLETIYWKVFQFTGRPNQANKMLENLSDILKYSLHQPREKVKIAEEINYTKSYLEIQKVRYKDKFDVKWQYIEDLKENQVMKLILQPLVENAIYYGIKEKGGKSAVKIKMRHIDNMIKVSIIDNGIGMKKEQLNIVKERLKNEDTANSRKVGLINTNKRLTLMYGDKSRVNIRSKWKFGTVVFFYIPLE